ncbi:acyltransferase family protein [Streptomyces orinoci]|uniref:Acyltransferase n=1 Tax=Streptomyces orinoci TaxID=67339 RepID=A0ABV3K8G7_STRON|nr:acyltransferase [Streptomyces orinoci]
MTLLISRPPSPRLLARRVSDLTPPGRDRALDALRAFAILGVVLGHWLVTALVATDGGLHTDSPLRHMPYLAPVSWVCQTLALFFFVGGICAVRGYRSARGRGIGYRRWAGGRLGRLARPAAVVLAVWIPVACLLPALGVPKGTVRTLMTLVASPMWFLLVFAALTAATPLVARLHPGGPLAVVAAVDLTRFALGGPAWLGWVNVAAGWLVPFTLGALYARGGLRGRYAGLPLLLGGGAATVALVLWGGYPASMVGVPGAAISNLSPPTLAAVCFGLAQCGLALLLMEPLRRAMRRPLAWAGVAGVNLFAMTVFLWHQTAMMAVTGLGLVAAGQLPALHTAPDGPGWAALRVLWVPVFGVALALFWAVFHRFEHGRGGRRPGGVRQGATTSPGAVPSVSGPVASAALSGAGRLEPVAPARRSRPAPHAPRSWQGGPGPVLAAVAEGGSAGGARAIRAGRSPSAVPPPAAG